MKKVDGFLAQDGTFFENAPECELYEAEETLRTKLELGYTEQMVTSIMSVISAERELIKRFINAREEAIEIFLPQRDEVTVQADQYHADDARTAQELASLLEQPIDRSEHVPNMGSDPQSAPVREQREGDGVGGRRHDASSVRDAPGMATGDASEATETRAEQWDQDIRREALHGYPLKVRPNS